jgi:F-type H+-transporting ATPase subunit b
MLIDWFTVAAQVINFLVLVWLLKRFLYKPILHAIDAREKRVAAELADADSRRAEAEKGRASFAEKNEKFERERAEMLRQATEGVATERARLLDEARSEADGWRAKRQEALRSEALRLSAAVSRRAQEEVFAIARKTLKDLAGTTLEERMSVELVRRLRALDGRAKEALGTALATCSTPAVIRSAFDLPPEHCDEIRRALEETFPRQVDIRFETAPEIVSGIELTANGQKLAWSISDYLSSLAKGINEVLGERDEPDSSGDSVSTPAASE